jgi:hypothetical protein
VGSIILLILSRIIIYRDLSALTEINELMISKMWGLLLEKPGANYYLKWGKGFVMRFSFSEKTVEN